MSNLRTSIADYVPAGESKERRNITAPAAHFILPFPAGSWPRCLREMPSGDGSPSPLPHGPRRARTKGQPGGSDRSPALREVTPAPAPAAGELAAMMPRRGCGVWRGEPAPAVCRRCGHRCARLAESLCQAGSVLVLHERKKGGAGGGGSELKGGGRRRGGGRGCSNPLQYGSNPML